jgi:hypothetical protein
LGVGFLYLTQPRTAIVQQGVDQPTIKNLSNLLFNF